MDARDLLGINLKIIYDSLFVSDVKNDRQDEKFIFPSSNSSSSTQVQFQVEIFSELFLLFGIFL